MSGIYIHIPFCKQACSYCDFYFVTRPQLKGQFVDRLLQEIESYRDTSFSQEPVRTIYFGGGTPSQLAVEQVESIMVALRSVFDIRAEEITLEMNPDDVTANYLSGLKQAGVTRASMGVQSFQPELLAFMNRAHTSEEAQRCLELLRASGFEAFTADLIYGNPGQTVEQLEQDINRMLQFDPPHLSAYSLTVEPNTRLGKQVDLGRITPPKDENVAEQFALLDERLAEHGIRRYEVSNYSKPGREAVHNSNYWQHENYLGFGPGAHSFWWGRNPRRWQNPADIQLYCEQEDSAGETEKLSLQELAEERIMMGLRTRKGITEEEMESRYEYHLNERQTAYLEKQQSEGRVRFNGTIALTGAGLVIADAIILDLITMA